MAAIGGSMGFIAAWKFNRVPHAMSASMALVIGPVAWNSALAVGGPTFESAVTAAACYVLTLRSLSADPPVALLKE